MWGKPVGGPCNVAHAEKSREGGSSVMWLGKDSRSEDPGTGLGISAGPNLVLSKRGKYLPRTLTGSLLVFPALRREMSYLPLD